MISILILSVLPDLTQATETTHDLSAIMKKEVDLGEEIKFDLFFSSSVTFDVLDKNKPGENITGTFGLNPASAMIFLEIPSINRTYATETEIPLEDLKPINVFDGVTLVIDLMPSANLMVTGPATLNQTNIVWDNFLEKQSFEGSVDSNASNTETITINSELYLNAKISVNIQLQNYTKEVINYPLPQMEMLPKIPHTIEIESAPSIFESLDNSVYLIIIASAISLIAITSLLIRKNKSKKETEKEIQDMTTKQTQTSKAAVQSEKLRSNVFCIYCGEQLPEEATYCRKCGKKIK
jgi:ribosomal protein L40E